MSTVIALPTDSEERQTDRESSTFGHFTGVFDTQSAAISTLIDHYNPRNAAMVSVMKGSVVRPFEQAGVPLTILSPKARTMLLTVPLTAFLSIPVDLVVAEVPPFRPIGSTKWHPWQKHIPFLCSPTFGMYVIDLLSLVSQVETALTPHGAIALFLTDSRHGGQYYSPSAKLITALGPHRMEGALPVRRDEDSLQKEDSSTNDALIPMVHHSCVVIRGMNPLAAVLFGNAADPVPSLALAERPPLPYRGVLSPIPAAAYGRETVRVSRGSRSF